MVQRVSPQTCELSAKILHLLLERSIHGAQLAVLHLDVLDVLLLLCATLSSREPVLLAVLLFLVAWLAVSILAIYWNAAVAVLAHLLRFCVSLVGCVAGALRLVRLCPFSGLHDHGFCGRTLRSADLSHAVVWRCNLTELLVGIWAVLHDLLHRVRFLESTCKAATMHGVTLPRVYRIYWLSEYTCALWILVCAIGDGGEIQIKAGTGVLAHASDANTDTQAYLVPFSGLKKFCWF